MDAVGDADTNGHEAADPATVPELAPGFRHTIMAPGPG